MWALLISALSSGGLAAALIKWVERRHDSTAKYHADIAVENREHRARQAALIADLERKLHSAETEVIEQRQLKHDAMNRVNPLNLEILMLKLEVNEILGEYKKPTRYDLRPTKEAKA